jgi:hypothetical protein
VIGNFTLPVTVFLNGLDNDERQGLPDLDYLERMISFRSLGPSHDAGFQEHLIWLAGA